MTRRWGGIPLTVHTTSKGAPDHFIWEQHSHIVNLIADSWRIDRCWWRIRVWRDYFKLRTTSGLLVEIYHDLLTDEWYLHRVYD